MFPHLVIHDRSCHVFVHPFIPQPDHLLSLLASLDSHFPSSASSLNYYFTTTTLPKAKEFSLKDLFLLLQPSHAAAPPPLTEAAAALLCRKSPEKAICTHTHTAPTTILTPISSPAEEVARRQCYGQALDLLNSWQISSPLV